MSLDSNQKHSKTVLTLLLFVVLAISVLLIPSFSTSSFTHTFAFGSVSPQVRNIYLTVKPDLGALGQDRFSPANIIVQQGDSVNITIRNLDSEGFSFSIQNYTSVTVEPGKENGNETEPVETSVPMFNATSAGIFSFSAAGHPDMNGYLVVLPADWTKYNPSPQHRAINLLVLPDFAGEGYDKFFPGTIVVNQGDNVSISVTNVDEMPHGLSIAAFGVNSVVNPAQEASNGTMIPVSTTVQTFTASNPGIYYFICTVYCGPGHDKMVGVLVVLPKGGSFSNYDPKPQTDYGYLSAQPDFAGEGYDKFVPGVVFANQGDLVYLTVRNPDDMPHGFTLTAFNINNETILPAVDTQNETEPTDTYITPFVASQPGIYLSFCSVYCGPGHYEMIGYLVVLPTSNASGGNSSTSGVLASNSGVSLPLAASVATGTLTVGIIVGTLLFSRQKMKGKTE